MQLDETLFGQNEKWILVESSEGPTFSEPAVASGRRFWE